MEQEKSFITKVYLKYKYAIQIVLGIIFFISGYLISPNFLKKQISSSEFKLYEQVARDVYEQGNKFIYEVPEGISVDTTKTSITISSSKCTYCGKVVARLKNGELVLSHDNEKYKTIVVGILMGTLFVIISTISVDVHTNKIKNKFK